MLEKAALLLGQARGAYQREQYEIALAYFRRAREIDPHSPEVLLGIGEVAAVMDQRGEAISAFLTLADIYTKAGMLEVAAEVIDRVLELDPTQPLARRFQQFIRGRLRRTTNDTGQVMAAPDAPKSAGPRSGDSIITALERQNPVDHSSLLEVPSETSLSQLVPWSEGDDSRASQATTAVANAQLDQLLGELEQQPTSRTRAPENQRDRIAFSDTLISNHDPRPEASVPIAAQGIESVVIDDDDFADVSTRAAPDGLMRDLANAARTGTDPFGADTVVSSAPPLPSRGATARGWAEATKVDPPRGATGSGQHDAGGWELDTTAAVMAENFRIKPRLSLGAIDWDESDFPRFEEVKFDTELITRTIALEGEGAVSAILSLMSVSPLLALLDVRQCQSVIEKSVITQCFAGQVILNEGDAGSSLFLLATGQASVEHLIGGQIRRTATISPGNFFGEGSLLADAPRSSTVRALEDALVLELDRALVQSLVAQNQRVLTVLTRFLRARMLSSLMMDSPLFHRLPVEERTDLAPRIHLHKLNPGQAVAQRGQVLTGFCTLMAGELKRFDLAEGTGRQALENLLPGSAFGSQSLYGEPSPVSIAAETGCWLLRLPTEDLRELVERHPELADGLRQAEIA